MKATRRRLFFVLWLVGGSAVGVYFILSAFQQNLLYYYRPAQVVTGEAPSDRVFRIAGLVVVDSVKRSEEDLAVRFDVTDTEQTVHVSYEGILPDLFREGQAVVAVGLLDADGIFHASRVLARHDENYMPPEVADALRQAGVDIEARLP